MLIALAQRAAPIRRRSDYLPRAIWARDARGVEAVQAELRRARRPLVSERLQPGFDLLASDTGQRLAPGCDCLFLDAVDGARPAVPVERLELGKQGCDPVRWQRIRGFL